MSTDVLVLAGVGGLVRLRQTGLQAVSRKCLDGELRSLPMHMRSEHCKVLSHFSWCQVQLLQAESSGAAIASPTHVH